MLLCLDRCWGERDPEYEFRMTVGSWVMVESTVVGALAWILNRVQDDNGRAMGFGANSRF